LNLDCVGSKSEVFLCVFKALILARISVLEGFSIQFVRLMCVVARPGSVFVR
jgi:hypothetical protein